MDNSLNIVNDSDIRGEINVLHVFPQVLIEENNVESHVLDNNITHFPKIPLL